jgi:hypothetical protein
MTVSAPDLFKMPFFSFHQWKDQLAFKAWINDYSVSRIFIGQDVNIVRKWTKGHPNDFKHFLSPRCL